MTTKKRPRAKLQSPCLEALEARALLSSVSAGPSHIEASVVRAGRVAEIRPHELSQKVAQVVSGEPGSNSAHAHPTLIHESGRAALADPVGVTSKRIGGSDDQYINLDLENDTNNAYSSSQIYIMITGQKVAGGPYCWLKLSPGNNGDEVGTLVPMNPADNTIPAGDSLNKNGINYTKQYAFPLSEVPNGIDVLRNDPIIGGRIWISMGAPLYLSALAGGGFIGPSLSNPSDPNFNTTWDSIELTLDQSRTLFANTTQVDKFAIPTTFQIKSTSGSLTPKVGITEPRDTLYNDYKSLPAPFQSSLASWPSRILNPSQVLAWYRSNPGSFPAAYASDAQQLSTYFDQYIKDVWAYYQQGSHDLVLKNDFGSFTGYTVGDDFDFVRTSAFRRAANHNASPLDSHVFVVHSPFAPPSNLPAEGATEMVFANDGVFKDDSYETGENKAIILKIENNVVAALNRHVLAVPGVDPNTHDPKAFYQTAPYNYFASFVHAHSIDSKAYGFPYDDNAGQSTTISSDSAAKLTVDIGWNTALPAKSR